MLVDERNPNDWIGKIDSSWSGAIPATIIYNGAKHTFYEGELDLSKLLELIQNTDIK